MSQYVEPDGIHCAPQAIPTISRFDEEEVGALSVEPFADEFFWVFLYKGLGLKQGVSSLVVEFRVVLEVNRSYPTLRMDVHSEGWILISIIRAYRSPFCSENILERERSCLKTYQSFF